MGYDEMGNGRYGYGNSNRDLAVAIGLAYYSGELLLVGINYDRDNKAKPHSCVIEKVDKA